MEARVDIRKLQLLNDRITQTIDALNQVRWSVHGLQHATGGIPTQGAFGVAQQSLPFPNQSVYGQAPFGTAPQAYSPYAQTPYAQQAYGQPMTQQPMPQQPYAQTPFAQAGGGLSPLGMSPYATGAMANGAMGNSAMGNVPMGNVGIQHSTATPFGLPVVGFGAALPLDVEQRIIEARMQDPYALSRTFPQAFVPTMGW